MNTKLRIRLKCILSKVIPDNPNLRYLSYISRVETWRKQHNESYPFFDNRYDLYTYLNFAIVDNNPINYLEFGVFKGATIKYWATLNSNPTSNFFGFDTFSGLPEDWGCFTGTMKKGTFDAGGILPDIEDERIFFFKGLFQDTLPDFLKTHTFTSPLVIHNDSDLYSSTLYLLTRCNDILIPGSIIIFDEFSSILHEFRALEDYCISYRRDYEVLGAVKSPTAYYSQIAVQMK